MLFFIYKEHNMANFQSPRGTQDIFYEENKKWEALEELIRGFASVYHLNLLRTPIFEHTEVFKRGNDSSDMVNKEMYTFDDRGGRSLTLRPEGTAGLLRAYVQHKLYADPEIVSKFYYVGPNFRYERPQKGRMRIHHQFGVEYLGAKNPLMDAEIIYLGYSFIQELGLKECKVLINTLGDQSTRDAYRTLLKDHFKPHVHELCEDCQRRYDQNPLRILDCKVDTQHPAMISAPSLHTVLSEDSKVHFDAVCTQLSELGIPWEVSDRLVRGLDYYSETVFEVVSTSENMGSQSTLFGGGRYDHLVEYFGGPSRSGVGFGMGLERILVAMEAEGLGFEPSDDVDVYVLSLTGDEARVQSVSLYLRSQGFKVEYDLAGRSKNSLFKAVERSKARVLVFVSEDNYQKGIFNVKQAGSTNSKDIATDQLVSHIDHLLSHGHEHCDH
jgi:histidyl-tRNA synthetase